LECEVDAILLDNFSVDEIRQAVQIVRETGVSGLDARSP
jgi:nicotinate-nucleotide pyrophosphorylase